MTQEELNRLLLEEFPKWVDSKNPKAVVGHPGSRCDCPIARFLRSKGFRAYVRPTRISICWNYPCPTGDYEFTEYSIPDLARQFIRFIDGAICLEVVREDAKNAIKSLWPKESEVI